MTLILATGTEPGIGRTTSLLNAAVRIALRGIGERPVVYIELDDSAAMAGPCLALHRNDLEDARLAGPTLETFLSTRGSSNSIPLPRNVADGSSLPDAGTLDRLWLLSFSSLLGSKNNELDTLAWVNRVLHLVAALNTHDIWTPADGRTREEPLFLIDLPSMTDPRGSRTLEALMSPESRTIAPRLLILFHTWRLQSIRRARESGNLIARSHGGSYSGRLRLVGAGRLGIQDEGHGTTLDGAVTLELATQELASELLSSFRRLPSDIPFDPALHLQPLVFQAGNLYFNDQTSRAFDSLGESIIGSVA